MHGIRKTQEDFMREFDGLFGNEYEVYGNYINARTQVEIKHKKCGTIFPIIPTNSFRRKQCNCPKCFPNKYNYAIPYINDIYSTNKELYNLLLNKDDGHKYKENSNKKTWFVCPYCGEKILSNIQQVNKRGLSCHRCGDGIPYPEKLMNNILRELNVDFNYQFSPEWAKPYIYDFEFKLNNKKYIIEIDGGIGHGNSDFGIKNRKETDQIKDKLAIKNGYNMIRIDANYKLENKKLEYIKNNIRKSELSKLFDLNNIDYVKCHKISQLSYAVLISKLWNNNIKTYNEIKRYLSVSNVTIRKYLKIACDIGLIPETYEEIKNINIKLGHEKTASHKKQKVLCNETGEIFNSYKEANEKYGFNSNNYFVRHDKFSGTLPDGTRLTWTKIEN